MPPFFLEGKMETPNLLRPAQVKENTEEVKRLEHTLEQPHVQDRGSVMRQLTSLKNTLDTKTPTSFSSTEIDTAVRMERDLREKLLEGMPTQEEMRRAPHGAIGKHRTWEAKNKADLMKWKYLRQRLNAGSDNPDIANFEQYRPSSGTTLDVRDAFIPKTSDFYGLDFVDGNGASVMHEEQSEKLQELDPDLHARMALLGTEDRAKVLALVDQIENPPAKKKRNLSPEQRKAIGEKLTKARAAARARKEAGE